MYKKELQIGGRTLSLETGAVARQANGACAIRYGDTVVLATACYKDGVVLGDFMPLTVDYKEYTYAGGRIPGGFFKREGRPTEKEILTSRLIDRPLRPSFQKGYRQETQIIALVLRSEEHTSELQSPCNLVCRLLLEKKKYVDTNRIECVVTSSI